MAEKEYVRLTRARRRATMGFAAYAGFSSLWLGKDHLLSIESTGYTEDYKRFYYRDIQAIIIRRTKQRLIWSLIIAAPLVFFSLVALSTNSPDDIGLSIFMWILAGVFGIFLFYNLILGPTVRTYMKSAVQTEELASLNRLGRARKAINKLRPLIAAAQGQLTPEEISAQAQMVSAATPSPASEVATDNPPPIISP